MNKLFFVCLSTCLVLFSCTSESGNKTEKYSELNYPITERGDVVEDYHGTQVADPYRWLEDPTSEKTKQWVADQRKFTESVFAHIDMVEPLRERLTGLMNYPKHGTPFKAGDNYYFYMNTGLQNQSVLYTQTSLESEAQVFIDPNTFSEDGTVSLSGLSFSKDGNHAAYMISEGGSDWDELTIMDVKTGEKSAETLKWIKFSGASWYKDGFIYSRFPEPEGGDVLSSVNENQAIYYHKANTAQEEDILLFEDKENPRRYNWGKISHDESLIIISSSEGTGGNNLQIASLDKGIANINLVTVVDHFDGENHIVGNKGERIFMQTNIDAPNGRLVEFTIDNPTKENWKNVIPESKNVLTGVNYVGERFIAEYLKDVASQVNVYSLDGKFMHEVQLPTIGSVSGFGGKPDQNETFYSFTSFTYPNVIFKYDISTNESTLFKETDIDFDSEAYEVKQVFYSSKDGTKVPMFLVHKKGLKMDGNNPTLLYGYGGFNINLEPRFAVSRIILLENGGIFAVPNLRGGGEYGEEWHKAGMLDNKQNVFDDFIAAAEYLIKEKYTSSEKLAISGRSNGGLLVGACMTQRPELFKVAFPAVGVLDMLRFHKFSVGHGWIDEYGSSDNANDFKNLIKFSPLHNIKEGKYPATMVQTAIRDDRVVPAHSFKFISELQYKQKGNVPVLIDIEEKAGHGAGKPTSMVIEEIARMYGFMFYNMDHELKH